MLKERASRGKLNTMGKMRAMEHQMEHPQTMDNTMIEEPSMRGSGGGDAGMKRVIGAGKRGRPRKMAGGAMSLNDHLEGEGRTIGAGKKRGGAMSLNDQLEGEGMCGGAKCKGCQDCSDSCSDCMEGSGSNGTMTGGAKMGKELGEQIMKLHGKGFFSDFISGLTSVLKPVANVASFLPGPIGTIGRVASGIMGGKKMKMRGSGDAITAPPMGRQVSHAMMSGEQLAPNSVAPIAYGSVPQAPASFQRNTIGMGKATHMMPDGTVMPGAKHGGKKALLGRPGHGRAGDVALEGEGFLSNLGIPIVSNIAGMFGLGAEMGGAVRKNAKAPKASMAVVGTGKRSARGQAISKLMKEKGMTLGQASKYLKENS